MSDTAHDIAHGYGWGDAAQRLLAVLDGPDAMKLRARAAAGAESH